MRSGTCPKCGSATVFRKTRGISLGDGGVHVYTGGASKPTPVEHYICTTCGYFEGYLHEESKRQAVAETWDKVD